MYFWILKKVFCLWSKYIVLTKNYHFQCIRTWMINAVGKSMSRRVLTGGGSYIGVGCVELCYRLGANSTLQGSWLIRLMLNTDHCPANAHMSLGTCKFWWQRDNLGETYRQNLPSVYNVLCFLCCRCNIDLLFAERVQDVCRYRGYLSLLLNPSSASLSLSLVCCSCSSQAAWLVCPPPLHLVTPLDDFFPHC